MNSKNIDNKLKIELENLKKEIEYHDDLYYNQDNPIISDFEYDKLRLRLNEIESNYKELITDDSPSQKIGSPINSSFSKINHRNPMLSLDNAFSKTDIENFIEKSARFLNTNNTDFEFCAEHKIDGLSASIIYNKDGILEYAATRGDGYTGENITNNLKTINNIPHKINIDREIEIRGEVYMPIYTFKNLNELRKEQNEPLFANPRNAAAGSLRHLDSNITASRNLKFFAYYINSFDSDLNSNFDLKTQTETLELLKKLGFSVSNYQKCKNISEIMKFYNENLNSRDQIEYEIDGIVFKINSIDLQKRLGFVGRSPRHSIAFKFPADQAKTKINDILISVGRTGKITPISILEPINLAGAIISKATLHNFQEIERKNISIGDVVTITRSGDVIPKIISVEKSQNSQKFEAPTTCPACKENLIKYPDLVDLYCINHYSCPSQIVKYISYFVSKNCFDIQGLGEKQIEEFYNEGRIKSPIDIFKLEEKDKEFPLSKKHGWGKKSAEKLYRNINDSKNISLPRFIASLSIKGVGESLSEILSDKFINIENLMNSNIESFLEIDGLGEIMSSNIYNFFKNKINIDFINEILKHINIKEYNKKEILNKDNKLYNKTIVFTGKLSKISRDEAKQIAISKGAIIASSISNKTDFVILGENSGSKLKKAQELNITILTEEDFLNYAKS